jgi:hypothetical protein
MEACKSKKLSVGIEYPDAALPDVNFEDLGVLSAPEKQWSTYSLLSNPIKPIRKSVDRSAGLVARKMFWLSISTHNECT